MIPFGGDSLNQNQVYLELVHSRTSTKNNALEDALPLIALTVEHLQSHGNILIAPHNSKHYLAIV